MLDPIILPPCFEKTSAIWEASLVRSYLLPWHSQRLDNVIGANAGAMVAMAAQSSSVTDESCRDDEGLIWRFGQSVEETF